MTKLSIDFETHSGVDLLKSGAYRYAMNDSTGVYMMAYAFDDDAPAIWTINEPFPQSVLDHTAQGLPVYAFNAEFEYLIWNYVLTELPPLNLNQLFCTAAQGRVNSLPGPMEQQARALAAAAGKSHNTFKDKEGKALIQQYSSKNIQWDKIPKNDQEAFKKYCVQDVEIERMLGLDLRELSANEWEDYRNTIRMNERGIQVDIDFAEIVVKQAEILRIDANHALKAITNGQVKSVTGRKDRDEWLLPKLTPVQLRAITDFPKMDVTAEMLTSLGVEFEGDRLGLRKAAKRLTYEQKLQVSKPRHSFDKASQNKLRTFDDLDPKVLAYLDCLDNAGGSTLQKYAAMLRSHVDGKVYGAFMFSTATTGRASSKLVQLQNMKRPIYDDDTAEEMIEHIKAGYDLKKMAGDISAASMLEYLVRPTIYRDDGMTVMDYSSVEYIALAYLSGNERAMEDYRNGVDAYKVLAAKIFDTDNVTKDQRQAAKIVILAAGFGGGKGAVQNMATAYGVQFTDDDAQKLIDVYRNNHPREVQFWYDTKDAIWDAIRSPGQGFFVAKGTIEFQSDGSNLWVELPSGRLLRYFDVKLEMVDMPWDEEALAATYMNTKVAPKQGEQWPRATLSHIVAVENICQAFSNDLLRDALAVCEQEHLEPFMMVHDEIVVPGNQEQLLKEIMETTPEWCADMPLKADGGFRYCYGK